MLAAERQTGRETGYRCVMYTFSTSGQNELVSLILFRDQIPADRMNEHVMLMTSV